MFDSRLSDMSDLGISDNKWYMCVNYAGYYKITDSKAVSPTSIKRKSGRHDYLFCYVAKGTMNVYYNGIEHSVKQGFFLLPPDLPQDYNNIKNTGEFEIYWIHFTGYGAAEFLRQCGLDAPGIYNTGVMNELPNLIEILVRELNFKKLNFELMTESSLMHILSIAARRVNSLYQNIKEVTDIRMQKALEYIYLNYAGNISIQELADYVNFSPSRFSALFKKSFGLFPLQYIINYRIKRACDYLRHTDLSITEIANMVGLEDSLYFSRIFKKQTGFSPSQYRNSMNSEIFFVNLENESMDN
jgi:AraC-like DNA-binding protein